MANRNYSPYVLAAAALIAGFLYWLGAEGTSWAWPAIALPALYTAGALLYRYESKLSLPAWAGQAIEVSAVLFPPIKWLTTNAEVQAANEAFVNDFNLTLGEYALPPLVQGQRLASLGRPLATQALAEKWREENQPPSSHSENIPIPAADTLVLIHRERSGEAAVSLGHAQKEHLIDELADLVKRNRRRIPNPDPLHPYTNSDVRALLDALRDFDVDFIAEELRAVGRTGVRLQRYADFLAEGRKESAKRVPDVTSLIRDNIGELPSGPSTLFRIESAAGTIALMKTMEEDGGAVAAVLRGIFLAEREIEAGALKGRAAAVLSQWSGEGDPIRILQAYLWEKGRGGTSSVSPKELRSSWERWSTAAKTELEGTAAGSFAKDRERLAERLDEGIWPTRRSTADLSNPYPLAPRIALPAHEEVRDVDAYLITFDERRGSVASVLDGLKSAADGKGIYRFGPYTRNTRLGIVPKGMPFHEFVERFFADLDQGLRRYRSNHHPNAPVEGVLRFAAGRPHSIVLEHDEEGTEPVEFVITQVPRACDERGEKTKVPRPRADGVLGEIEPWLGDDRRALVRYFPAAVSVARHVCFEYTSRCGDEVEPHKIHLLIQPRGEESELDQIEITLNRIDLAHSREVRFGDSRLGAVMRSPSIYDVWETIAPELEEEERPSVRDAFERVAGGPTHP